MAEVKGKAVHHEVIIDKDKCNGCRLCIFHCPTKHLELSSDLNKNGVTFAKIKKDTKCIGCGFCFYLCPEVCIEIHEEKNK